MQILGQKNILFIALFVYLILPVYSQETFSYIDKNAGLPHNDVECMIQDREGFMWFGTRNGLARFDGYDFKIFKKTDQKNSLSDNRILSLAEDSKNNIWIGTYQNGVNKYDKVHDIFYHYGIKQKIGNQVYAIKSLKNGQVLIGSSNGLAIYLPQKDSFLIYQPNASPNCLNSYMVFDILVTKSQKIYLATAENDIQYFDYKNKLFYSINYLPKNLKINNYRKKLIETKSGNILIISYQSDLYSYNPTTKKAKTFLLPRKKNNLSLNRALLQNTNGQIWLATDGDGIYILDENLILLRKINKTSKTSPIIGNQIYALYQDRENRIWVGLFGKGLAIFDPFAIRFNNTVLNKKLNPVFKDKSVISIAQDNTDNSLWLGTDGEGLYHVAKNMDIQNLNTENSKISSNVITSIAISGTKKYIGTYAGGLNILDKSLNISSFKQSDQQFSIHSDNVWDILIDSKNHYWLGLLGAGVDLFNPQTNQFTNLGTQSQSDIKIDYPNIMDVFEDNDGDIWFATEGNGIYILDKQSNKIRRLTPDIKYDMLFQGRIEVFYQDWLNYIWIGTEGLGLYKYDKKNKKLTRFGKKEGLPSLIITGITEDNRHKLWVSTYDGLALFNNKKNQFLTFNTQDGLNSNEFNNKTLQKLKNGNLIVGSKNGLNIFNPLNIHINQNIPKVYITKLSILNKEVHANDTINNKIILSKDILFTKKINLDYSDKIFALEFAALNYTQPSKCKYKYRLLGFNDQWIETTAKKRYAVYSNLKSGSYHFQIKASNNDNKWGNNVSNLEIIIKPPFWETSWFYALIILFILLIIYGIFKYNLLLIKKDFDKQKAIDRNKILELEKKNIKSELDKLTFYVINRDRVLLNFKQRFFHLSKLAKEKVKNGLEEIMADIDNEINDDKEWKYIEPRLDEFYNNFITKLKQKHPDITQPEIKIASYVRMNMSSKEIAELMNKTARAVENDRYRLRKKLKLSSKQSLRKYLADL